MSGKNNEDLNFKGQYPNEIILSFFRHHWILVLPHLIVMSLLIVSLISILVMLPVFASKQTFGVYSQSTITGLFLFIGFFIHVSFVAGLKHFLNIVIITNLRIIEVRKSIFLEDSQDSLSLIDIRDIKRKQKSFLKNVLGYGDLLIMLQSSERTLFYVPNLDYHFRLINKSKENCGKNK